MCVCVLCVCTVVSRKYAPLPLAFLAQSLAEVFLSPPLVETPTVRFKVSVVEWQRKNKASIHRTAEHFSIARKFIYVTRLSTVKLSTTNADPLQQQWTRQLLCGSALLPWPSTLKLVSLPLELGASLCLAFYTRPPLPPLVETPT